MAERMDITLPRNTLDLKGLTFGKLTALHATEKRKNRSIVWRCRCACGQFCEVPATSLFHGNTKSCGCLRSERGQQTALDITGERYGKLTAIAPTSKRSGTNVMWKCRCDCGNEKEVPLYPLRSGLVKSCGCSQGRTPVDIKDMRFGKLTAVEPTDRRIGSYIVWKCKCDCGKTCLIPTYSLRSGRAKSCGCKTDSGGKEQTLLQDE